MFLYIHVDNIQNRSYSLNPLCPKFVSISDYLGKLEFEFSRVYCIRAIVIHTFLLRLLQFWRIGRLLVFHLCSVSWHGVRFNIINPLCLCFRLFLRWMSSLLIKQLLGFFIWVKLFRCHLIVIIEFHWNVICKGIVFGRRLIQCQI